MTEVRNEVVYKAKFPADGRGHYRLRELLSDGLLKQMAYELMTLVRVQVRIQVGTQVRDHHLEQIQRSVDIDPNGPNP